MQEIIITIALFFLYRIIRKLSIRSVGKLRQAVLGHCPDKELDLLEVEEYLAFTKSGRRSNRDQHVRLTTVFRSGWNEVSDRNVRARLGAARRWLAASGFCLSAFALAIFIFFGDDIIPFLDEYYPNWDRITYKGS